MGLQRFQLIRFNAIGKLYAIMLFLVVMVAGFQLIQFKLIGKQNRYIDIVLQDPEMEFPTNPI